MKKKLLTLIILAALYIGYTLFVTNPIYYLLQDYGIKKVIESHYEEELGNTFYEYEINDINIIDKEDTGSEWKVKVIVKVEFPEEQDNIRNIKSHDNLYHINKGNFAINYSGSVYFSNTHSSSSRTKSGRRGGR